MSTNRVRSSGFSIERRTLLWLPAAAAAALLGRSRAQAAASQASAASFQEFLAAAQPLARRLHKDGSPAGQDAYLYQLAALAVRVQSIPEHPLFPLGGFAPGAELGPAFRGVPFVVIEWRLAPDAVIPAHNHPSYSVCTVGLGGEAEVEHYEVLGRPAADSRSFRVRRSRIGLLERGRIDTLSAFRDNVHSFRAGRGGARGIDITTLHGTDTGFRWLEIAKQPVPGELHLFEARWREP